MSQPRVTDAVVAAQVRQRLEALLGSGEPETGPALGAPPARPGLGNASVSRERVRGPGDEGTPGPREPARGPWNQGTPAPREPARGLGDEGAPTPRRALTGGPVEAARGWLRAHLAVVGIVAALALGLAGWQVLSARAVPLPTVGVASASVSSVPAAAASGAGTPATSPKSIMVHVLGAVARPGVVSLPAGSRVADALAAAGGLSEDADPAQLNLAAPVEDGCQILIGTRASPSGEVRGPGSVGGGTAPAAGTSSGTQLDLNAATQAQLEALPGVGPVTAQKIIEWRTKHGRFTRVEQLQEIDGIGPKTYAQIAPRVRV